MSNGLLHLAQGGESGGAKHGHREGPKEPEREGKARHVAQMITAYTQVAVVKMCQKKVLTQRIVKKVSLITGQCAFSLLSIWRIR